EILDQGRADLDHLPLVIEEADRVAAGSTRRVEVPNVRQDRFERSAAVVRNSQPLAKLRVEPVGRRRRDVRPAGRGIDVRVRPQANLRVGPPDPILTSDRPG
ncbi:MAG: hypothetical protein ACK56I_11360, partial [bacterium]